MTIETYTVSGGDTYILVHPAGLSYYDQAPEAVNKFNASDAFVIGDLLYANANTSSGELWTKVRFSPSDYIGLRQGVATAASGSGSATVSIKRIPRKVLDAAGGTESAFSSENPGNGNGGDSTNSGRESLFNNTLWSSPLPLATLAAVVKPSAESWGLGQTAYGYILAGSTLYTNSNAIANSQTICWLMGEICFKALPGTTSSYVLQSCCYDASIAQGVPLAMTSNARSISGTLSGSEVNLSGSLYASPDGLTISATATAACNILMGICVGIDKTASTHVYSYFDTFGMYSAGSSEAVNASLGGTDLFFLTPYILDGKNGVPHNGYSIIASVPTSSTLRTHLCAPILLSKGSPALPDIAYDAVLPAPFTDIRVIWTLSPGPTNSIYAQYPVIANKNSRTTAPNTGMVAALRDKPERNTTLVYTVIYITPSGLYPLLPESRSTPYTWNNYWYDGGGFLVSNYLTTVCRGCMFPRGKFIFPGFLSSDFKWRWEAFDFTTSTWTAITSFVVGTGGTAGDVDISPPTGLANDEVFTVRLVLDFVSGGTPSQNYQRFVTDYSVCGVWPWDIVKAFNDADSGGVWAGNSGWIWPTEPAGPAISWVSEPSFSLVGNTLTMTTTTPTRTITPDTKFRDPAVTGYLLGLGAGAPSMSITYDDGDSAAIPNLSAVNVAATKGGATPYATRLRSGGSAWTWGSANSMTLYPSKSGSKKITVKFYYTAIISSAYTRYDQGYASPRIITQTFTLP